MDAETKKDTIGRSEFANNPSLEHCHPMVEEPLTLCGICGAEICDEGTLCQDCQRAFEPNPGGEAAPPHASSLDLQKYNSRMFPWEQMTTQPRLIRFNPIWLFLAIGLVVLVLLLALLRTPLPSCWEISS